MLPFHLNELKSSTTVVEIGSLLLEKKILLFPLFRNYLPMEKGGALHLNKVESPSSKDDWCQVSVNCPSRFEEEYF